MCVKVQELPLCSTVLCCWPLLLKGLSCTPDGFLLLSTPVVMEWVLSVSPPVVFCHTLVAWWHSDHGRGPATAFKGTCFSFFLWKSGLGLSPLLLTTCLVVCLGAPTVFNPQIIPPTTSLGVLTSCAKWKVSLFVLL